MTGELTSCTLCPNQCRVKRIAGETGLCCMDDRVKIASYGPHFGEEPELVGYSSSGTIFFSGCNLLCEFCQNYEISHHRSGDYYSVEELTEIMLRLQQYGCHNINLVTPTHFSIRIIESIKYAKQLGLSLPVVYNTNGYDLVDTLRKWEGLVDIYMPDLKFIDTCKSGKYTIAGNYFEYAKPAIIEMQRQVGDLVVKNGIARRGLLIRHLIMPDGQSDTYDMIDFIAENIGTNAYLNLMEQYRPEFHARNFDLINRRISSKEYMDAVRYAKSKGFRNPEYIYRCF